MKYNHHHHHLLAALFAMPQLAHGFVVPPSPPRTTISNNSNNQKVITNTKLNMFTGIIEEMGQVLSLETKDDMTLWDGSKGKGTEMVVQGGVVMEGAYLG